MRPMDASVDARHAETTDEGGSNVPSARTSQQTRPLDASVDARHAETPDGGGSNVRGASTAQRTRPPDASVGVAEHGENPGPGRSDAPVWFALDISALDSAQRTELAELEAVSGGEGPRRSVEGAPAGTPRTAFITSRRRLEASAGPCARVLLHALEAATAPPARPRLMGIVNVTPDSFSDGGRYLDPEAAIEHGLQLAAEGADLLDIGGESSRPGAAPVTLEEELGRVLPVVRGLRAACELPLSIDTTKALVAQRAVELGASMVNDISAGSADPRMLRTVAQLGVEYVCMHMRGAPATMQVDPRYEDPVAEVAGYLRERLQACAEAGIDVERVYLDPGIGFGKALSHNLLLMRHLGELRSLGRPLLVGVSRKSFIGHLTEAEDPRDFRGFERADQPNERIGGSIAAGLECLRAGAEILRVHDVAVTREALMVFQALRECL